jgi:hypothetical protein
VVVQRPQAKPQAQAHLAQSTPVVVVVAVVLLVPHLAQADQVVRVL